MTGMGGLPAPVAGGTRSGPTAKGQGRIAPRATLGSSQPCRPMGLASCFFWSAFHRHPVRNAREPCKDLRARQRLLPPPCLGGSSSLDSTGCRNQWSGTSPQLLRHHTRTDLAHWTLPELFHLRRGERIGATERWWSCCWAGCCRGRSTSGLGRASPRGIPRRVGKRTGQLGARPGVGDRARGCNSGGRILRSV